MTLMALDNDGIDFMSSCLLWSWDNCLLSSVLNLSEQLFIILSRQGAINDL